MKLVVIIVLLLCAIVRADGLTYIPESNVPGQCAYIPVVHQQQETKLCVPTAASMVFHLYGQDITPREIKLRSMDHDYNPKAKFHDYTFTKLQDIVPVAIELGHREWRVQTYKADAHSLNAGFQQLKARLDSGNPSIVEVQADHVVLLIGYSNTQSSVFLDDPNKGLRAMSYAAFLHYWRNRDGLKWALLTQK